MTDQTSSEQQQDTRGKADEDIKADVKAIIVMFCAAIGMAVLYISNFTFDF